MKQHLKSTALTLAALFLAMLAPAAPGDGAPAVVVATETVHAVIGERVTLSAEVAGAHPLRYCWRKDGEVLPGETGATLKIKAVLSSAAGAYTVEVANQHGTTVSEPITLRVCAPSLRIYRQHGIKLTFKARKCVRYTIECKELLSEQAAWNVLGTVENRNGTVRLTDHAAQSHLLCVFRLKAEEACSCDGHHDDWDDDGHDDEDEDNGNDDDDSSDEEDDEDKGFIVNPLALAHQSLT